MTQYGTLYGIGIGPGDPDLVTLAAVKALAHVDKVFASSSTKNDSSLALSIARPHLREGAVVEQLGYPMTSDRGELEAAWKQNSEKVLEYLASGQDAAVLTLGDPMFYSTFGYLLQTVRRMAPPVRIRTIPGVTSFQASAAETAWILAEAGENFQVISGVCNAEKLRALLQESDNAVILKAYRNFGKIRQVLHEMKLAQSSLFVSRLGLDGEIICRDIDEAPDSPNYLSLVLVKNPNRK